MIAVSMTEEDVVDLLRQSESFRVFWIVLDERVDQDIGTLRRLNQHCGVSKPGDACAL